MIDNFKDIPTLKERYELMIKARNFHYENYNKWMTYFYVAIAALFVGLCTIVSSSNSHIEDKTMLEYLIIVLGYIVSLLWFWSSKGYYYWNINYIMMVHYYEKDLLKLPETERVYMVFANKNIQNNYISPITGANISTSKIAILFAFISSCVWGFIFVYLQLKACYSDCLCGTPIIFSAIIISIVSVLAFSSIIPKNYLYSKQDHLPDLKINQNNS